jgi:hypothetical protein
MHALAPLPAASFHAPRCRPRPGGPAPAPQRPVPIPPGPAPDWSGTDIALATGRWWVLGDAFLLRAAAPAGEADGYGTWVEAVAAARVLSVRLGRSLGIFDHQGRLYLRQLDIPSCVPLLAPDPYVMGSRQEQGIAFRSTAIRGIVHGNVMLGRGDCLEPWVEIPSRHA